MNTRKIAIEAINNHTELFKALSFACREIKDLKFAEDVITVYFQENTDFETANRKIDSIVNEFIKNDKQITPATEYKTATHRPINYTAFEAMTQAGLITNFKNGFIGLNNEAIKLFGFFDKAFQQIAKQLGAVEKQYPVLLPVDALLKTDIS